MIPPFNYIVFTVYDKATLLDNIYIRSFVFRPFVHPSIHPSTRPSIRPSIQAVLAFFHSFDLLSFVSSFVRLFVSLFLRSFVRSFVRLFICLLHLYFLQQKEPGSRQAVMKINTKRKDALPIIDVAPTHIGESAEPFRLEIGPVCFMY